MEIIVNKRVCTKGELIKIIKRNEKKMLAEDGQPREIK